MNQFRRGLLVLVSCLLIAGCGDDAGKKTTSDPIQTDPTKPNDPTDPTKPNDPVVVVPSVTGITPASGKAGTVVTVSGKNLDKATAVCFGSQCVSQVTATADKVSAAAPEGTGTVDVFVKVGDKSLNAGQFKYLEAAVEPTEIDWCRLTWVESAIKSGEPISAYAQVFEDSKTGSSSDHSGIFAEVGVAPADAADDSAFEWKPAKRNEAFAGEEAANNDEYMADNVTLADGSYRVAFRFSLDEKTWKYCDRTGSDDGFNMTDTGTVVVAPEPENVKTVGWCRIMNGETRISTKPGADTEFIFAQAYVEGCTNYQNRCTDLKAEIGYGSPALADEAAIAEGFEWLAASVNPNYDGSGGENHDEFMSSLKTDEEGTYSVFYRMSVDGGKTWTYCDTSDDTAFSATDAVTWYVSNSEGTPVDKKITWCQMFPSDPIEVTPGTDLEYRGQVYAQDVELKDGGFEGVKAWVGVGTSEDELSDFVFTEAAFDKEADNNAEYKVTVKAPAKEGDYQVVYGFSLDDGDKVYCGTESRIVKEGEEFKRDSVGKLTVSSGFKWGDGQNQYKCGIVDGSESYTEKPKTGHDVYGQIYINGCTTANSCCLNVVSSGIRHIASKPKDLNFGSKGWYGVEAVLNDQFDLSNANDEYVGKLSFDDGTHYYAYEFDLKRNPQDENEKPQTVYCFAGWKSPDEATVENLGVATIEKPLIPQPGAIDWCQMFPKDPVTVRPGEALDYYGQALVPGCTGDKGPCASLKAWVGYGTKDMDLVNFSYTEAAFEKKVGDNDEFKASIKAPKKDGDFEVVYAFSLNDGEKVYCSTDDSTEFDRDKAGKLTVSSKYTWGDGKYQYKCGIVEGSEKFEFVPGGKENVVYGQIYINGCTTENACCKDVLEAGVMYSTAVTTIDYGSKTWYGKQGKLNTEFDLNGNNDEYMTSLLFDKKEKMNYSYYFKIKTGDGKEDVQTVYCYVGWKSPDEVTAKDLGVATPSTNKI